MVDMSIRCLLGAAFITVISAIPYMGVDRWAQKDGELESAFDSQINTDELRPDLLLDPPSDTVINSLSQELDRVASLDPNEDNNGGQVTTHRGKRFGFGLLPMSFSYRLPMFPRRNRRINSRNYVAMRGKRLQQEDDFDYTFGRHQGGESVSKRRGFTALRG